MARKKPGQLALPVGRTAGEPARVARVRRAVDSQIAAQRLMLQIEDVDAGLIGIARSMADALDREIADVDGSTFVVVTGLAKLVPVLLELRGERRGDPAGVGWDEELAALAGAIRNAAGSWPTVDRGHDAGSPGEDPT